MRSAPTNALLLFLALTLSACSLRSPEMVDPGRAVIHFENASSSAVRVYLVGASQDWLLGWVDPGREVVLRFPEGFPVITGGAAELVVLPMGATGRFRTGAGTAPGAIHSGSYLLRDLPGMKWVLAGERLFAHPLGWSGQ